MSYQEERLQEIADAIREVKGTTEKIPATNFASEIVGLSVVRPSGIITIKENGTHNVANYEWAEVNVEPALREKDIIGTWASSDGFSMSLQPNGAAIVGGVSGTYEIFGNQVIINIPENEPVILTYNSDTDTLTFETFVLSRVEDIREKDIVGKWLMSEGNVLNFKTGGVVLLEFDGIEASTGTYEISGINITATLTGSLNTTFYFNYNEETDTLYDPYQSVTLTRVQETANLITKEITENGTYKASDEGADGYSEVVVNVAGSGGGGDATPKIYGVSWVNDASTTMTRTDDAVGMSYSISNGRVTSDFDNVFPYNQMKRTVIDGNTFVFVPAMWFRVVADSNKKITSIAVSSVKGEGDNWYPTRPFYYGAYGASSDGTVLKSVSGASRMIDTTRAVARQRAMAVGEKYHQLDLYSHNILMFLWWIEFADKNSQNIMSTYSISTTGGTDAFYNEQIGDLFYVSGYDTSTNQSIWHGIEDFFSGTTEWADGLAGNGVERGDFYVSDNYMLYDDYSNGSKMTLSSLKLTNPQPYQCIEAFGWDSTMPFLCVPITTRNDTAYTSGFCDMFSTGNAGNLYLHTKSESNSAGISYFSQISPSYAKTIGCRLVLNV